MLIIAHLCNDMSIYIGCVTGVMVAWTGIEHFKLGRIQKPPPIDEPEDVYVSWSKFLFTLEEQQSHVNLSKYFLWCENSLIHMNKFAQISCGM